MKRQESKEDYLETILQLYQKSGAVRAIDIAAELGFSKPSVSVAMKSLRAQGFIETDKVGHITLTPAGKQIAADVSERHRVLTEVLIRLGVSESVAKEDACHIEHDLSDETFTKIKEYLNNAKSKAI